jgi:hypothetical protein
MLWRVVETLRPPGWPVVPPALRPRLRALAVGAIAAQVVFVAAWIVAGAIEPGYSPVDSYVSELGADDAAHAWIVNAGILVFAAGFAFLAAGLSIVLRGRPWALVAPALFAACAVLTAAEAAMTLDCQSTVDAACDAREHAGDLSWHHYGHGLSSLAIGALLVATPFALARAERPSLLAKLTFASGVVGLVLWIVSVAGGNRTGDPVGLYQRISLAVIHYWVVVIAVTLLIEASGRFAPARPMQNV